jgi:hypothetical protein
VGLLRRSEEPRLEKSSRFGPPALLAQNYYDYALELFLFTKLKRYKTRGFIGLVRADDCYYSTAMIFLGALKARKFS